MPLSRPLKEWMQIVSSRFSHLSLPQVRGLASWSFGIALSQSSSLSRVAYAISQLNDEPYNTARQRLKEWYQEAAAKSGKQRQSLEVSGCFLPLLGWVMALMPAQTHRIALAMDASNIRQRFTVLSISVLYEGCAIPVAWKVVAGGAKGSWKPYWQALFEQLKQGIADSWQVIVCADRGLYADWLYHSIVTLGWHPFLRINPQGLWQPPHSTDWQPLSQVVPQPDTYFEQQVRCFKGNPLDCTLLGYWGAGYQDPWLIVTDLQVGQANVLWYRLRAWIECSYRDCKSDGWRWQHTRLQDPQRAERLWLAMAVAMLWVVTLGSDQQRLLAPAPGSGTPSSQRSRALSCFSQGWLTLIVQLIRGFPLKLPPWSAPPIPQSLALPYFSSG